LCPKRPEKPISRETTAKLKPIDLPWEIDPNISAKHKEEDNCPKIDNFIRFVTLSFLELMPDDRVQVASTMARLSRHFFSRNVKVLYSGNKLHVTCDTVESKKWPELI
jgi:hypothetical protein